MANLITTVDRTTGTYDNVFIYTMNASFNGVQGEIESAQIQMEIPNYFTVYMGDVEYPVLSTTSVVGDENTVYTFDFGAITDLGIAVRIGFGLVYNYDAENYQEFTLTSTMIINGETVLTNDSESIMLEVAPRFELSHEVVLPQINPAPGGEVYYKATLQNFGDLGGTTTNVDILIDHPTNVVVDTTYDILGYDVSTGKVVDTTYNGRTGEVVNNQVLFTLPEYSGEIYEFIYRANISDTALVGNEVTTTAAWSRDAETGLIDVDTFVLADASYEGTIEIYGPTFAIQEGYICNQLYVHNVGNQIINDVSLTYDLAEETKYYSLDTGSFYIAEIEEYVNMEYTISYTTDGEQSGVLGTYNTDTSTRVELADVIGDEANLTTLTWNFTNLGVGFTELIAPELHSIALADLATGSTIFSSCALAFTEGTGDVGNFSTVIQDLCRLQPVYSVDPTDTPVRPGETITFTIGASCLETRLQDPIFAMILPHQLEYTGNETITQSDFFEIFEPAVLPEVSLTYDFNEDGDTLVAFRFRDEYSYDFRQGNGVSITFTTEVKAGEKGTATTQMLLNTLTSVGDIPTGITPYDDTQNIADDVSVTGAYATSSFSTNQILLFVSTASNKKVKGSVDEDWLEEPLVGSTLAGGNVQYQITLSNIGNADLNSVEIVDILPYIGDTGVIQVDTERESKYPLYNISEAVAQIVNTTTGEVLSDANITFYYSTSNDPVRFGSNFDIIGTDDNWVEISPEDLTTVQSFKIIYDENILDPGYSLVVNLLTTVPVGTPTELVAWNSFAAKVNYTDTQGTTADLLAIEPEKVGVAVVDIPVGTASISGFAFEDQNTNGTFEDTDVRFNDIGVVLYNEDYTPLYTTFTTTSYDGVDGYYEFSNLEPGNYYVKFFIDSDNYKFSTQVLEEDMGSKADATTGMTPLLTVVADEVLENILVGFLAKGNYTISQVLEVNKSARSMLRNVIYDQMLIGMKMEDTSELIFLDAENKDN